MTISVYNIAKAPMGRFTATALESAVCSGRRLRHSKQQPWQLPPLSKGDLASSLMYRTRRSQT